MKREEFFTIMDCVSEEDAAEMMRYCRSEQLPDREEEIVMTKHTDHAESGGKRSKSIAAAVAAVLVCANVAGGAYLLRNSNTSPETGSNAGESIQTDAVEVVTASGQTEPEPAITTSEAVEAPQYVKLMQEYFTKTGEEPCTFDFTGYGKDFDIQWENDDYKLTFRAVTGCEWALYYFYDVEPKKGQTWEQFVQDNPHFRMYISSGSESPWESQYTMGWSTMDMMGQDKALDNGVWHFCTYLMPQPGVPLYMNYTSLYFTLEIQGCSDAVQPTEKVALDFFQYQHPMHELETPVRLADVCEGKIMTAAAGELMLTQRAETPFGVFYCGEPDEPADKTNNFTEYACAKKDGETLADYVPSEKYQRTIGNDMIAVQSDQPSIAEPSNVGVQQQIQFMNLLFKSPVPLKNAKKSASEDMQGIQIIPSETTEYVQLMQDYYTKLNGQPCTYDFTGMGMDINVSFEDDLYILTHKAVVGCDWFLFYFYDITPKEHFFEQYNGNSIYSSVRAKKGDKEIDGFSSIGPGELMPGLDPDVPEDGVFHCYVKYVNDAAVPFFHGENAGAELVFPNYSTGEVFRVEFVPEEIPLQKKESPKVEIDPLLNLRDNEMGEAKRSLSLFRQRNTEHPLTRCADTPFGRVYYSDCFTPDSEYLYQNSMDPDRCTQDSTFLSYNGIDSSITKESFFGDLGPDLLDPNKYRVFTLILPYTVPGMIDAE